MWQDQSYAPARGSFERPVLPPDVDPTAAPTKTVTVACKWLPYIRGALMQLLLQATWQKGGVDLTLTQMRAMTLISLFEECEGSFPPLSCTYQFPFSPGDPLGWSVFCDVPHGCFGHYTGSGFESNPGTPGPYQQLQVISPHIGLFCDTATVVTTSAHALTAFLYNWDGVTPTLLASATVGPGVLVHTQLGVFANVDSLRWVLTNEPADGSGDAIITLAEARFIVDSPTGVCP